MNRERYVLCVDDEPLLLEGLELTLRESFEVVTETKPLAALARPERKERDFVAIVSDMRMPLMDGAKFLACAAEIAPKLGKSPHSWTNNRAQATALET